jgi:hypothetical protein
MKKETLKKYIGNTFGVLTVLSLERETYNKETQTKRTYFKCKCNRCGEETVVRADRCSKNCRFIPKSCTKCTNELQAEIAENRWKIKNTKWERGRINSIRSNAKSRTISLEISENEIKELIYKKCFYCGDKFAKGIDRIDSKVPYIKENCVPCCYICNRMKNKYSLDIFLEKIKKIHKIHIEGSTTIPKGSTLQANGNGNGESLRAVA